VAPVGMVFLLWLVAASAILAQTIRKFSRPPDNQEPHSDT
jgi:hypothetical protein